jgi:hypothetical protein
MIRSAFALLFSMLIVFAPGLVQASSQGVGAQARWKAMDKCSKVAQDAFPDFTAESNAKREAKLQECLAGQNLPPHAPNSPAH